MVSIIIPTHNRAQALSRAITSVAAQSFSDWELLVVDDASTDHTAEVLTEWTERLSGKLTVIRLPENRGVSAARNAGVEQARGTWLAFLDSDDEWLPQKLELQMPLTHDHVWVHGEEIWVRNGVRVNPMNKHRKAGGQIFSRCVELCCVSPSSVVIRKDIFLSERGFREDFPVCEDYELWLRLSSKYPAGFVETPVLLKYGGHEDQLSRRFKAIDYFRCKALIPFLDDDEITTSERAHVAGTVIEKCDILVNGYLKHGNLENILDVREWRAKALRTLEELAAQDFSNLSDSQSTHSTTDLRPRSDETTVL